MLRLRASNSYINMILSTWLKKLKCCVRHWIQIQGLSKIVPQAVLTFQEEIATKKHHNCAKLTSQLWSVMETVIRSDMGSVMGSVRWSVLRSVLPNKCMSGQLEIYKKFIKTVNDSPTVHEISTDYPRRCHMKIFCPGLWRAASQ